MIISLCIWESRLETAVDNLKLEGYQVVIPPHKPVKNKPIPDIYNNSGFGAVFNVGDVMYDAALMFLDTALGKSQILNNLGLSNKDFVLATVHRPQNTDCSANLSQIINGLLSISKEITVVFPMHPRTRNALLKTTAYNQLQKEKNLLLTGPASYLDMLVLEKCAAAIITDSGGVQHEAAFFMTPCVTLLEHTPWVETVTNNWNRLCPPEQKALVTAYREAVTSAPSWEGIKSCYGAGKATQKIINILDKYKPID